VPILGYGKWWREAKYKSTNILAAYGLRFPPARDPIAMMMTVVYLITTPSPSLKIRRGVPLKVPNISGRTKQ